MPVPVAEIKEPLSQHPKFGSQGWMGLTGPPKSGKSKLSREAPTLKYGSQRAESLRRNGP